MLSNSVATFSLYSDLYARFRPAYPEALYQWLLPQCSEYERAWDCATGNGQTAVRLGDSFARVDATDISSAQLGQAEAHNQVYYRECPAEVTPFDDASFDLITVSQALHWFHFPSFWPEVGRVLKPGGVFAAWGYHLCRVSPEVDRAAAILTSIIEPFWSSRCQILWDGYSTAGCPLPALETPELAIECDWTLEQYLGFLNTLSASKLCKQTLGEHVLDDASGRIARAWGDGGQARRVGMPLSLLVARRPLS
ncbi:class I SAM-dependent methyltransferase [Chromobacterium alkanivorans]|uniref:class I SAM-dependent methyltransferase n=1 Tax=Chromobacterium alkanivorans TaxID=1071719 RepID=UPI001968351A|nr:class I SAM-dependent methyltransferase [Chromobacterium alkanivorans]MBN3005554.1 class I SAM-dependent methyltransferase [Chromobacterium alkanivorans]